MASEAAWLCRGPAAPLPPRSARGRAACEEDWLGLLCLDASLRAGRQLEVIVT